MKKFFGFLVIVLLLVMSVFAFFRPTFKVSATNLEPAEYDLPYVVEQKK